MTEIKIIHEERENSGRYTIPLASDAEASMSYRRVAPSTISIDHTLVPPEFRGQKIADRLMVRAIEDAKTKGDKIIPACSYVAAQFKRHPEWADLLADPMPGAQSG